MKSKGGVEGRNYEVRAERDDCYILSGFDKGFSKTLFEIVSLVGNGAQQVEQILRRPRQAIQAGNNGLARPLRRQIGHGGLVPSCGRRKLDLIPRLNRQPPVSQHPVSQLSQTDWQRLQFVAYCRCPFGTRAFVPMSRCSTSPPAPWRVPSEVLAWC
jgi:hypothetical protein